MPFRPLSVGLAYGRIGHSIDIACRRTAGAAGQERIEKREFHAISQRMDARTPRE